MIPAPRNGEEPIPSTRSGNRGIEALQRENISLNQEIARLRRQRDFLIGLIAALVERKPMQ